MMKVTLTEYARLMGVTYVTAYRWAKQGKIQTTREGKYVYVESNEGRQTFNAVVYAPTGNAEINHEQIENMIEIHKIINKARFKTTKIFYEAASDGLRNLMQLINSVGCGTVLILGYGARKHIVSQIGEQAAEVVLAALKAGRKVIDVEEKNNE